ncbi:hypothetical protein IE81DRAFT_322622 [Ceraceosorus guamensis]|uniref:mRNA decay factor PAT1 domain-containing protein n=1 Tax=Ceraceosorus guamensis TaxID=1522189 RepID=A0A316W0F5_9BASI|nr:hypothetical protein IE81DRAFT_322622 [Ceraceosorus guamensis]PWN43326.1 hypothetical protein IE81DRAFT_322622 [Ceraceosorus guamensis]
MSFFGFDTTLPGKVSGAGETGLEGKFRNTSLGAGAREDVEIYTWGQDGNDGLGDLLEEEGDDFNDDTFGFGGAGGDVGTDFDFAGQTAKQGAAQSSFPQQQSKPAGDARFVSTLDDFWGLPSAPVGAAFGQPAPPAIQEPPQVQGYQPPPPAAPQTASKPPPRTMDEVEAEMRAAAQARAAAAAQQQSQPSAPSSAPASQPGRPLTLEEVEAQMRARQQQQQQQQHPSQPVPGLEAPQVQPASQLPPAFPSLEAPQPGAVPQLPAGFGLGPAHFPPLGATGPRLDTAGPRSGTPGISGRGRDGMPPAAAAMHNAAQNNAAAKQAHMAHLKALLDALPAPVREGVLRLPPHAQFASLEGVAHQFPGLLRPEEAPNVIGAALAKLSEVEQHETRLARRAMKIQAMSHYNNLMTISDKDFITRIQVSTLVTQDPYADDFYAHIYFQLRGGGPAQSAANGAPSGQAQAGGRAPPKGPAKGRKGKSARDQAMSRMQAQVERIVQNRKERSEKAAAGAALEGALGRVGPSTTKAPRQMLQVDARSATPKPDGASGSTQAQDAVRAALQGTSLAHETILPDGMQPALGKHVVLGILEKLYEIVLSLEQMRRSAPSPPSGPTEEPSSDYLAWQQQQSQLVSTLWSELRVLEPLQVSDPHPFISLMSTIKGKRLLPRALRHLTQEQVLTALTLIVATFSQLDIVRQGSALDVPLEGGANVSRENRREAARQTEAFSTSVVPAMLSLMAGASMRIVSGMLALFVERNDLISVAKTRPGIAFLTIFLSRAETLRQGGAAVSDVEAPSADELEQWTEIFGLLFRKLTSRSGELASLFPSSRARNAIPFGSAYYEGASAPGGSVSLGKERNIDSEDEPVWNLMAALAVSSATEQQHVLVQELREKILENVFAAREWAERRGNSESDADLRIRNVNLLVSRLSRCLWQSFAPFAPLTFSSCPYLQLHALNLDAAQITV